MRLLGLVAFVSARHLWTPTERQPEPATRQTTRALARLRGGGGLAFDAALFDFDGTLVQSEGLHRLAFGVVLGEPIDEEEWEQHCVGTSPAKLMADRLPPGRLKPGETIVRAKDI